MNTIDISIRKVEISDMPKIKAILLQVHLAASDILVTGTKYWLAEDSGKQPIGIIGLELGQEAVLLRSAAVSPAHQKQGIGTYLVQYALSEAKGAGYQHVYLFSTDAGAYWQRQGFHEVAVSELVAHLPQVPQVKEYERLDWLPTEVAWRLDLDKESSRA